MMVAMRNDMYTVKQLSDLAGVSPRTLHYYDEIGLLRPTRVAGNGYRQYGETALYQLQQILFYREMGMALEEIRQIVTRPDFNPIQALERHKAALHSRQIQLERLIDTVDQTILRLKGKISMSDKKLFEPFNEQQQKEYEKEAAARWPEPYAESARRWKSYTDADKQRIGEEGEAVYRDLVALMEQDPGSQAVQQVISRWHQHLRYFYEPSVDLLRGLGHMYNDDPRFAATFAKIHPDLAQFHQQAIDIYCDRLEKAQSK